VKKIKSKSARHKSSQQTREKCDLIRILKSLGVITDVKMRGHDNGNGTVEWSLVVEAEVRDER